MGKRLQIITLVALLFALSGCVGGIVEQPTQMQPTQIQPTQKILPCVEQPTANMIQTDTEPPYGAASGPVPPGDVTPVSTDTAQAKGLASNGHLNDDYATVQNMYRAILLPRLVDTLGLAAYDEELAADGIVAASGDKIPFSLYAQQCAGVNLNYLYIRNNLYVERLTQDQIDTFLALANDPDFATNPDLDQIVTDTYPQIIRLYDMDGDVQVGFDGGFRFYNDAVVVYLTTSVGPGEWDPSGHFTDLYYSRRALVNDLINRLQATLQTNWDGHISFRWA